MTAFETGAQTHTVNDLVLFTDNTKRLAALRDDIFNSISKGDKKESLTSFSTLMKLAIVLYRNEFKHDLESYKPVANMSKEQKMDYCNLYLTEYKNK